MFLSSQEFHGNYHSCGAQRPKHYLFSSLLMKLLFLCEYSPLFRVTRVIEGGKFAGPGDLDVLLKVLLRGH